jgi:hypothetical protein
MGVVVKGLAWANEFHWPVPNSTILIEDNVGEELAIHIHMGGGEPSAVNGGANWAARLHFTYEEFEEFAQALEDGGEL